jgi:uncharacterized membrane protein (UPF0127 family)
VIGESLHPHSSGRARLQRGSAREGVLKEEFMKTLGLETADGRCVAHQVRIADTFIARWIGWRREKTIHDQQGLLLIPGGSILTVGMRFPVDVVFLDRRMRVLRLAPYVAPRSLRLAPSGTALVLQLAAGRIAAVGLPIGIYIVVEHDSASSDAPTRCLRSHVASAQSSMPRPIQFSLRLPPEHRGAVHSNFGCSPARATLQPRRRRHSHPDT